MLTQVKIHHSDNFQARALQNLHKPCTMSVGDWFWLFFINMFGSASWIWLSWMANYVCANQLIFLIIFFMWQPVAGHDGLSVSMIKCSYSPWSNGCHTIQNHHDAIIWNHFLHYWPFVKGIHQSLVDSPHKGASNVECSCAFYLLLTWTSYWTNSHVTADLAHHNINITSLKW